MVFVNDKKFACESCIKGHRSSSCHHTERPLFEIKKKGRPVSQCEKCRELRKTKRVHSKCVCSPTELEDKKEDLKQLSSKSKRYIPIRPTLPNGLKDVLRKPTVDIPADPRAQVGTLLNPCHCKDVWTCKCRNKAETGEPSGGLAALAQAAALCCGGDESTSSSTGECGIEKTVETVLAPNQKGKGKERETRPSCCQPSRPSSPPAKRRRRRSRSKSPITDMAGQKGPSLPPILCIPPTSALAPVLPPPEFPAIPPLNAIASLAGTGCTCGFDCTCPGCVEHRGPQHAEKDSHSCSDGCNTCVDHSLALELPKSTTYGAVPASPSIPSFMEAFLARAAALPLPPSQRASVIGLDPTNVTVYPTSLFDGVTKKLDERGRAFGLVQLPKLECCAGRCGCPGDSCGCGANCNGCCAGDSGDRDNDKENGSQQQPEENVPSVSAFTPPEFQPTTRKSCCSG